MDDTRKLTKAERQFKIVYAAIILLFSIEFIGEGWVSVYRILIFPLLLVGCVIGARLPKRSSYGGLTLLTSFYLVYMALALVINDGNFMFPLFTIPLAIVVYSFCTLKNPIPFDYSKVIVWYSFPQILSFIGGFAKYAGGRFCGLHYDPNFCGIFLSLSAIAGLVLVFRKETSFWHRLLYLALLLFSLVLMFLSGSRGAMLSFGAVLFYFFLIIKIHYYWKIIVLGAALVAVKYLFDYIDELPEYVDFNTSMIDYVLTRFKPDSLADGSHRTYLWKKIIEKLYDHGSLLIPLGRENALAGLPNDYSHNTYLDFLVEIGVLPGIMFVLCIVYSILKTSYNFNKFSEYDRDYLICGLALLLQLFFLSAMSQKIIWVPIFYIFSLRSFKKTNYYA